MEKTVTSVEWFFNELQRMQYFIGNDMLKAYKQAKEIHKQECVNFYIKGCEDTYGMDEGDDDKKDAEQYYNQTFKQD